jgi:hypothetical protein
VPLSKVQIDILRLLAAHRDPESDVAGSTPGNRHASRYFADIDVFRDREERVARAAFYSPSNCFDCLQVCWVLGEFKQHVSIENYGILH